MKALQLCSDGCCNSMVVCKLHSHMGFLPCFQTFLFIFTVNEIMQ